MVFKTLKSIFTVLPEADMVISFSLECVDFDVWKCILKGAPFELSSMINLYFDAAYVFRCGLQGTCGPYS